MAIHHNSRVSGLAFDRYHTAVHNSDYQGSVMLYAFQTLVW